MKLNLFILVFALGFLTACNIKEISDLEDQGQDLKNQLEEATDPATIQKLQIELIKKQKIALIQEKQKERRILFAELEKTTDRKGCENLKIKLKQMEKEIIGGLRDEYDEYQIATDSLLIRSIVCGDKGYEGLKQSEVALENH